MKINLLEKARSEIFRNGYTVLENLIPNASLDVLTEKMDEDASKLLALNISRSYGGTEGHLQLNPPPISPYVFAEIITNQIVCAINKSILGDDLIHFSYSGNTNCPNSKQQIVHCDYGHLWPYFPDHPPTSLVVNIVLDDVSELNGSTEIWPGTHKLFICEYMGAAIDKAVPELVLATQSKERPSIRLNLKKGSIVIRDPRMWHRGTVNSSQKFRHMIAMIHSASWVKHQLPSMIFDEKSKAIFDNSPINHSVKFVSKPFDYLTLDVLVD